MIGVFFLLISHLSVLAQSKELLLKAACLKSDLSSCEALAAYYIEVRSWDKAYLVGEALCEKESSKGCTFAGTALISQGKAGDGVAYLTKGCDGLEPFACLSLSRIMERSKEKELALMYKRRSCFYGLSKSCQNLKFTQELFSKGAKSYFGQIMESCDDTSSPLCRDKLKTLNNCPSPLTKKDCLLLPGELSIQFRAKLIQESAKLHLLQIQILQEEFRKSSKGRYSYDLKKILKSKRWKPRSPYVFGFQKACATYHEKKTSAVHTTLALEEDVYKDLSPRTKRNIIAFFGQENGRDCYDPKIGYEAYAVGNLDPFHSAKLDIWKINRDGNILQLKSGLPEFWAD
jgi:hypothetical protein